MATNLNNFFNIQSTSQAWASGVTQTPSFNKAQQVMAGQLSGVPLPKHFYKYLVIQLYKALDIDIGSILVWGWRKRQEIIRLRDKKTPAGKPDEVELFENTVESTHSPTIQPIVNGVPLGKLQFDIVFRLTTTGFILLIQDGKVIGIRTGDCTGSGSIEYEGYAFIKRETAPLRLPGKITLKEPIAI